MSRRVTRVGARAVQAIGRHLDEWLLAWAVAFAANFAVLGSMRGFEFDVAALSGWLAFLFATVWTLSRSARRRRT